MQFFMMPPFGKSKLHTLEELLCTNYNYLGYREVRPKNCIWLLGKDFKAT